MVFFPQQTVRDQYILRIYKEFKKLSTHNLSSPGSSSWKSSNEPNSHIVEKEIQIIQKYLKSTPCL